MKATMFTVLTIMMVGALSAPMDPPELPPFPAVVFRNSCSIKGTNLCDAQACNAQGAGCSKRRTGGCMRYGGWKDKPMCTYCWCSDHHSGSAREEVVQHSQMPQSTASGSATQIDHPPKLPPSPILGNGCSIKGSDGPEYSCDAGACFAQGGRCEKYPHGDCMPGDYGKWDRSPACTFCWCSASQQDHGGSAPEASKEAVQHLQMPASGSATQIDDDCEISVAPGPSMVSHCNPGRCWDAGGRCKLNGGGHCVPDLTTGWLNKDACRFCLCKVTNDDKPVAKAGTGGCQQTESSARATRRKPY